MTTEEHSKQAKLCVRFSLLFVIAAVGTHTIERWFKADLDLGFTFLWIAVLMIALGFSQHLKSLDQHSTRQEAPSDMNIRLQQD